MKIWDKGYETHNIVERFTIGRDRILDLKLAKHDIRASRAHATMLESIGLLSSKELEQILPVLESLNKEVAEGTFSIAPPFEDVHSKLEHELVQQIGDAGKKIHTARSRNDQVLAALHLYAKEELELIGLLIEKLFDTLISLASKHKSALLPGYTHMQVAMPSSFGLWFSAYAESLIDDLILLKAAYQVADQNPLGSAAGYGSSFPIKRNMTTDLLDFSTLKYNAVAAQMSRGKLEKTIAFALSSISGTLSKLSTDICLYMSQNFGFVTFPKELTTGSSIMPHKQNPDVFELLRAKSNKVQNLPAEIGLIVGNLSSGYHRDLQLLKESLIESIDTVKDNLEVCEFMLQHIIVNADAIESPMYDYLYSVEEVNKWVLTGMSFRDAYQKLGAEILDGNFNPEKTVNHSHEGSIGNLCLDKIQMKFDQHKAF